MSRCTFRSRPHALPPSQATLAPLLLPKVVKEDEELERDAAVRACFAHVHGHDQACESLIRLVKKEAWSHLIVSGPPGCSKTTLIRSLFAATNSKLVLELGEESQDLEAIRERILPFLDLSSVTRKFVYLVVADRLHHDFENALRMILERPNVTFVFECGETTLFTAPLRSRCTFVVLQRPDAAAIERVLRASFSSDSNEERETVIRGAARAAKGDVRVALNLMKASYDAVTPTLPAATALRLLTREVPLVRETLEAAFADDFVKARTLTFAFRAAGYSNIEFLEVATTLLVDLFVTRRSLLDRLLAFQLRIATSQCHSRLQLLALVASCCPSGGSCFPSHKDKE